LDLSLAYSNGDINTFSLAREKITPLVSSRVNESAYINAPCRAALASPPHPKTGAVFSSRRAELCDHTHTGDRREDETTRERIEAALAAAATGG